MLRGGFKAIHGDLLHIRFREKILVKNEKVKFTGTISSGTRMQNYSSSKESKAHEDMQQTAPLKQYNCYACTITNRTT